MRYMTTRLDSNRVRVRELSPGVRALIRELRKDLGPYGWRIYVQRSGKGFSVEFRNPLSPLASGIVLDRDYDLTDLTDQLLKHIKDEPEFDRTRLAQAPVRKRELVGRIRWAATSYDWSPKTFEQVIDTMHGLGVITSDERAWINKAGPAALQEDLMRDWQRHVESADDSRRKAEPT
jgi:hypothetical protein